MAGWMGGIDQVIRNLIVGEIIEGGELNLFY